MSGLSRSSIVAEARRWIGTPYAHQASLQYVGCDCLGLLRGVWRALIGDEPETPSPYAPHWPLAAPGEPLLAAATRHLSPVDSPQAGDILLFRWRPGLPASHIAILTTENSFVHAHEGASVAEISFTLAWNRRLAATFAFPGVIEG